MSVLPRQTTPALLQVEAVVGRLRGAEALQEVCRFLRAEFPHYRWVGVYALRGEMLRLAGWDGDQPTEHVEIPVGLGVCGRAARERKTVLVDDVRTAPEYLACFLETRAEVVVPVLAEKHLLGEKRVLGEIDIDGNEVGAFDRSDAAFLEKVAAKLVAPLTDVADAPSGDAPSSGALPVVRR